MPSFKKKEEKVAPEVSDPGKESAAAVGNWGVILDSQKQAAKEYPQQDAVGGCSPIPLAPLIDYLTTG